MELLDFAAAEGFGAKVSPLAWRPRVQQRAISNVDRLISRDNLMRHTESVLNQPDLYGNALRVTGKSESAVSKIRTREALKLVVQSNRETMCFLGVHAALLPLAEFCGKLNGQLALPCFAHAYRSPANAQVFTPHWDSSSLLFVQMRGRITWRVWDPVIPSTNELGKPRTISPTLQRRPPTLEVTLSEGDAMFVPAGWPHGGHTTQGRETLYVTVEVRHLNYGLTSIGACC